MTLASQGLSYYILFKFGSDSRGNHWEMGPLKDDLWSRVTQASPGKSHPPGFSPVWTL